MAVITAGFTVLFPEWFDERAEFETRSKGYLSDVEVHLDSGLRYQLFFVDPVRLAQDLDELVKCGKPYFAESNMVVIPEVCPSAIHAAVAALVGDATLAQLKPSS